MTMAKSKSHIKLCIKKVTKNFDQVKNGIRNTSRENNFKFVSYNQ